MDDQWLMSSALPEIIVLTPCHGLEGHPLSVAAGGQKVSIDMVLLFGQGDGEVAQRQQQNRSCPVSLRNAC